MRKSCDFCGLNTLHNIGKGTQTSYFLEAVRPECIQTDIQAVNAGFPQGSGHGGEKTAVGGETQLLQSRDGPEPTADVQDTPADQG